MTQTQTETQDNACMETLQRELDEARETIAHLERRQKIDQLLAKSDAMDMDVARLLTEQAIAQMDAPDLHDVVDDLKRTKPYLFRKSVSGGAMAPMEDVEVDPADHAAKRAATTGHRRDLLAYLRLRRDQR